MKPNMIFFPPGALALISGCDDQRGPTTWVGIRLASGGLAVCTEVAPEAIPDQLHTWIAQCRRTWIVVAHDVPGAWCLVDWWQGTEDRQARADCLEFLAGENGPQMLLLVGAVFNLAAGLFPIWKGHEMQGVEIDIVSVLPPVRGDQ